MCKVRICDEQKINSDQIFRNNVKKALLNTNSLIYVAIPEPNIAAVEQTLSCC